MKDVARHRIKRAEWLIHEENVSVLVLTSRPGKVAHEINVDIARPRRIEAPEVSSLSIEITARLREEVRRHANDQ